MNILVWSVATPALVLCCMSTLWAAQDIECLDRSQTEQEIQRCLKTSTLEEQVSNEFDRVSEKFEAYKHMREYLQAFKDSWRKYQYFRCAVEAAAVPLLDRNTKQVLPSDNVPMIKGSEKPPIEVQKASAQCFLQTAQEMYAILVKL